MSDSILKTQAVGFGTAPPQIKDAEKGLESVKLGIRSIYPAGVGAKRHIRGFNC